MGQQYLANNLISDLLRYLPDRKKRDLVKLHLTLSETRNKVRELCEILGVEYSDDVYLPDILERVGDAVDGLTSETE